MENIDNKDLDEEFRVFRNAILEFATTVKNDTQLHIYIKESRKYIEFLITYYLRLGKLGLVKQRINELDRELLDEIERMEQKIG